MQVSSGLIPALDRKGGLKTIVFSPTFFLIAVAFVLVPLALVKTIPIPLGAMFWDQYLYIDAANRIADGQVPAVDFFAPAGSLGYYLFAAWTTLFPKGAILLLASWSLLAVTAPLLALVMPPAQAVGLLLPLLMLMDLISLPPYWGKWEWRHSLLLMAGGVPGSLLGWWVFGRISPDGVRLFIGLTALGFVLFQIARSRGWLKPAGR